MIAPLYQIAIAMITATLIGALFAVYSSPAMILLLQSWGIC